MDLLQVYAAAGAVLIGAALGFVLAGIIRSGGEAEAGAELDRLRAAHNSAEGRTRIERTAKELKQAECDELARQLKAAELRGRRRWRLPDRRVTWQRAGSRRCTRQRRRPMPPKRRPTRRGAG